MVLRVSCPQDSPSHSGKQREAAAVGRRKSFSMSGTRGRQAGKDRGEEQRGHTSNYQISGMM